METQTRIPVLVLTGGPCAGKSTALSRLRQKLQSFGVSVVIVPEVATDVFTNGVRVQDMLGDPDRWRAFQMQMVRAQIAAEDIKLGFAQLIPAPLKVVICDRGVMDNAAYLGMEEYQALLYDMGLSVVEARDKRYDGVFHLVTAARGAEEFYNLENAARSESIEEARALDERTAAAWTGHRNLRIIGNSELRPDGSRVPIDFEAKMERLIAEVCRILHLPVPRNQERKFLLAPQIDLARLGAPVVSSEIELTYLRSIEPGVRRKIRIITPLGNQALSAGLMVYTETRERAEEGRVKTERVLEAREYLMLRKEADTNRKPVRKVRHSFVWEDLYLKVDVFHEPEGLKLLEVECTEEQSNILLPESLHVLREVTGDPGFRNSSIAKGHNPLSQ